MPAEEMDVQMRHFLVAMPTDIGEQAITRLDQSLRAGDLAHSANETRDLIRRSLGREVSRLLSTRRVRSRSGSSGRVWS